MNERSRRSEQDPAALPSFDSLPLFADPGAPSAPSGPLPSAPSAYSAPPPPMASAPSAHSAHPAPTAPPLPPGQGERPGPGAPPSSGMGMPPTAASAPAAPGGPTYGDPRSRAERGSGRYAMAPGGGASNQLRSASSASFWSEIEGLQARISVQLAEEIESRGLMEEEQRDVGRRLIEDTLREHVRALVAAGSPPWDAIYTQRVKDALINKLFGLGRLQELVDDESVENIEITGYDQVLLLHSDGRRTVGDPIAESDEQLIRDLAFIASRRSRSERAFTPANPFLKLALPGGQRLQATAWVTPRPKVVIRRDRL
ncbi:MAG: hypothetical protein Q4G64_01170, partial [bacterium]|nr:hypothetical protein [bacterium]